jgi:hypothetical protein
LFWIDIIVGAHFIEKGRLARKVPKNTVRVPVYKKKAPMWMTPPIWAPLTTYLGTFNHLFGHLSLRRTTSKPATSKASRGSCFPYKQE